MSEIDTSSALFADALRAAHMLGGGKAALPFLHEMMKEIDPVLAPAHALGGETAKKQLFQAMFQRAAGELGIDFAKLKEDYRDFVQDLIGRAKTDALTGWMQTQPTVKHSEAWKSDARHQMRLAAQRALVEVGIANVVEIDSDLSLKTVLDW